MLSFVIAEEDLRIETSYPFNKVTAVFLLDNYRFFIIPHTAMNPYHIMRQHAVSLTNMALADHLYILGHTFKMQAASLCMSKSAW